MIAFFVPPGLQSTRLHFKFRSAHCPQELDVRLNWGVHRHFPITGAPSKPRNCLEASGNLIGTTRIKQMATGAAGSNTDEKQGILMLCLGNICRSPAAEAMFKKILSERNMQDKYFVDSCGTGGGIPNWYKESGCSNHEGNRADSRMIHSAEKRGLSIDSLSRPLRKEDFDRFTWIVAMDSMNLESIETARNYWGVTNPKAKVVLLSEFSRNKSFKGKGVPDPYWSGQDGFEEVLDILDESCTGLADYLQRTT